MTPDQEYLDYYDVPRLSHSQLKEIRHSPGHFRWKMDTSEAASPAMNLGSLVHAMVLEPHIVERRWVVVPKIDRRTKAGRELYESYVSDNSSKYIVMEHEFEVASAMRDAVMSHPHAGGLVENVIAHGSAEKEFYWTDSRGIERKAKVDGLVMNDEGCDFVLDLKTTADASPHAFKRSIAKYCYGTQMAYYCEAAKPIHNRAMIIAVANTPPFGVGLYRFDSVAIARSQQVVDRWLDLYKECMDSDEWPTRWDTVDVEVPDWFLTSNGVDR
jgi:hypothetical protein